MPSTITAEKASLRRQALDWLASLSPQARATGDQALFRRFLALPQVASARTILLYHGMDTEPDTVRLLPPLWELGKRVCLPRTGSGGEMDFADISAGLHVARYGIPEPDGSLPALEPGREDVIIVPAVCCDRSGARLGQGGGYYDRYLARYPDAVTVCLCRERLLSEKVPVEWNDVRPGYVITEERIIKTGP